MIMAKEDLQYIRNLIAQKGVEFTPSQVIELLRKAKPELEISNLPGLLTELKKENGNTRTSRPPIDT
jgi:hypothetical protein